MLTFLQRKGASTKGSVIMFKTPKTSRGGKYTESLAEQEYLCGVDYLGAVCSGWFFFEILLIYR